MCTIKCKGYRPKMLLLMMEEHFHILEQLRHDNQDGHIMLSYELLLLAESHCKKKHRHSSRLPQAYGQVSENLPGCLPTYLEWLTWAVYDGILMLGPTPLLETSEPWGQIVKHLADKVLDGLHPRYPAHTSAEFVGCKRAERQESNRQPCSVVTVPPGSTGGTEAYPLRRSRSLECRQQMRAEEDLSPMCNALKWMKECQHSYTDEQLDYWNLLHCSLMGVRKLANVWHIGCCPSGIGLPHWTLPQSPSAINTKHRIPG